MEKSGNRIFKNSSIAILYEIVSVLAGLILPRLILVNFGSNYNGIISSVTQFLSFVVLFRSGIGSVSKVYLYKSLKENDNKTTSMVMCATKDYMSKVSAIFLVGLVGLAIIYPFVVSLEWASTALLVLICGLSSLMDNYYGISSMILLQADRREYLISISNIVVTVMNTLFTVLLIRLNLGVHIVKFGSALAFCIKPIYLFLYVKKKYALEKKVPYPKNLLNQKKDAFVHVASEFLHRNTAIIALTVFTNTLLVSVYSVYNIVINGMRRLVSACTANIESVLGRLYASEDKTKFYEMYSIFEYCTFLLSNLLYICCACLFCSFINVYTAGLTDIEYVYPLFAILLSAAEFFSSIKTPYQFVIRIAGHFKQTKWISFMEAAINLCLSLILVHRFQLIGVAIGNIAAMLWRTVAYAVYTKKYIINTLPMRFFKHLLLSVLTCSLVAVAVKLINLPYANSYWQWILQAFLMALVIAVCILIVNLIFSRKELLSTFKNLKAFVTKRKKRT